MLPCNYAEISILGMHSFLGRSNAWLKEYNEERHHSGKYCYGKTLMQTFIDSLPMANDKMIGFDLQTAA